MSVYDDSVATDKSKFEQKLNMYPVNDPIIKDIVNAVTTSAAVASTNAGFDGAMHDGGS